jgi:hypothetical protein
LPAVQNPDIPDPAHDGISILSIRIGEMAVITVTSVNIPFGQSEEAEKLKRNWF